MDTPLLYLEITLNKDGWKHKEIECKRTKGGATIPGSRFRSEEFMTPKTHLRSVGFYSFYTVCEGSQKEEAANILINKIKEVANNHMKAINAVFLFIQ